MVIFKASAIAPSNIAFSKYWGKYDDELTLPNNDSISMSLDSLSTQTTVEFAAKYAQDEVWIGDSVGEVKLVNGSKKDRVVAQLNRLRTMAGVKFKAKMVSKNNFPTGVGIASSASAFSALTAATLAALKIKVDKKQQSILTRLAGSGSATRSVFEGFVLWRAAKESENSYAYQLYDKNYWHLIDLILITSTKEKKYSSLSGHTLAATSPFYQARLQNLKIVNANIKQALKNRDIKLLGETIEHEMYSMHAVAMTSKETVLYWNGATVKILHELQSLREQGLAVYATLDAGPNVHLIMEQTSLKRVQQHFADWPEIKQFYVTKPGRGVKITNQHLF